MAWESRQRGGRYYTQSYREDGRVRRRYVGGGPVGQLAATLDEHDREQRAAVRRAEAAERAEIAVATAAVAEVDDLGEALARLALVGAGYHRHHRGAWRKRRGQETGD